MDPSETLEILRDLTKYVHTIFDGEHATDTGKTKAEEFADAFKNLDEWISRGGFLPRQWSKNK